MSDLATTQPTDIQREASSTLAAIVRAASDPATDVSKLERLLALHERLLTDQRRTSYMAAMARLQAKLPQISKTAAITNRDGEVRNRYAKLEDIDVVVRPLCAEEGFSFSFDSEAGGSAGSKYICTMSHRDGHAETKTLFLPIDSGGTGRGAVQNAGSSLSYARRYLLSMHLNIITRDEDNDGNGAPALVTAEQAEQLRRELAEVGGSEARFLVWLGVSALEDVPAARFGPALKFIDEKRRQKARPA